MIAVTSKDIDHGLLVKVLMTCHIERQRKEVLLVEHLQLGRCIAFRQCKDLLSGWNDTVANLSCPETCGARLH